MHLKPEELVDLAEGTRAESSAPHLDACADCRRQLGEMRAMMSEVHAVDVPEPSPMFWSHLSARVSDAVASEPRRRGWLDVAVWRQILMPGWAVAIASIVLVVALSSRLMAPPPLPPPPNSSIVTPFTAAPPSPIAVDTNSRTDVIGDAVADDASLMLVASLTSAMDLDAASDAGLAPSGAAEHALAEMRDTELRELQRLLKEEMVGS
jgi:hypothetical protein